MLVFFIFFFFCRKRVSGGIEHADGAIAGNVRTALCVVKPCWGSTGLSAEKSIPLSPLNVSIHVGTNVSRRRKDRVS